MNRTPASNNNEREGRTYRPGVTPNSAGFVDTSVEDDSWGIGRNNGTSQSVVVRVWGLYASSYCTT